MKPRLLSALLSLLLASTGCELADAHAGRAADEWTRRYSLSPGGTVEVDNANGRVDVEAVDSTLVEVRAERIARAATDARARELLARLRIEENVTQDRVWLRTGRTNGFPFGRSVEVRYHIRAPKTATIRAGTTNGSIHVRTGA
jgi:hypothetical protein